MKNRALRADLLLLITAAIWGLAFVAQRVGMDHMGPFTFNAARFALGSLSLLPLVIWLSGREQRGQVRTWLGGGVILGLILFMAGSLQQIGLLYTTAGKAGFITGLYIVFVPFLGLLFRQKAEGNTWLGAAVALTGLYFVSINEDFTLAKGDALETIGALFWALHLLVIARLSPKTSAILLALVQFITCTLLSLAAAFIFETPSWQSVQLAAVPVAYAGLLSVGVAYTLQVVAQKDAPAAHAAILLSLEAVFAALGGWWLLNEILSERALLGCCLMLAGMLLSQLPAIPVKALFLRHSRLNV